MEVSKAFFVVLDKFPIVSCQKHMFARRLMFSPLIPTFQVWCFFPKDLWHGSISRICLKCHSRFYLTWNVSFSWLQTWLWSRNHHFLYYKPAFVTQKYIFLITNPICSQSSSLSCTIREINPFKMVRNRRTEPQISREATPSAPKT